jgi:glycosyltransferase involved in cell wall biosynthesis
LSLKATANHQVLNGLIMMETTNNHNKKLTIIIPAYNEEKAIKKVLHDLIGKCGDFAKILVIDDGSTDRTAELAQEVEGVRLVKHRNNYGYGRSIKTGVLLSDTEYVCTFDADGQHKPEDVARLFEHVQEGDMVVGARGFSAYKNLRRAPGKMILYLVANMLVTEKIHDLNSGLRVVRRKIALRYLQILPDGFSASTNMTMCLLSRNYHVVWVPIQVEKRTGTSHVKIFSDGFNTLMLIIRMILLYNPLRFFLPISLILLTFGLVYGVYKLMQVGVGLSVGSMLILMMGFICFLLGLISDQISSVRLEKNETLSDLDWIEKS